MGIRKRRAFTLIELLMVITIIGILAGLIIVSVSGVQKKARDTQKKNYARTIVSALTQYQLDGNSFPVPVPNPPGGVALTTIQNSLYPNYLNSTAAFSSNLGATYSVYNSGQNYALAYQLENTSEGIVTSGNGVYPTSNGAAIVNNISSSTLSYDGSDDRISIPSSTALEITGDMSLSFWLYVKSGSTTGGSIGQSRLNPLNKAYWGEFALTIETSGSLSYYHGQSYSSYMSFSPLWAGDLVNDRWYHIVITRNSASRIIKGYKNCVLRNTSAPYSISIPPKAQPTQSLLVGSGYSHPVAGFIRDVRIYNSVIDQAKIDQVCGTGQGTTGDANEPGLVAAWAVNEGLGSTAKDIKGANDGSLLGGPIWATSDQVPYSLIGLGSAVTGKAFVVYGPQ
ncbi:MAG: LamG-like jellyroll fold domain-containing protein [bacterium]|nr:LamG-like jellyroll fold domain-containing protein [bacterium]